MSFSIPFREFARLKLVASMSPEGDTSMKFEPSPAPLIVDDVGSNAVFHFQSNLCNGINTLTIYVTSSSGLVDSRPTPASGSVSQAPDRSDVTVAPSPGGGCLDTLDSSFGWVKETASLDPLFSQFQTSSFSQNTPDVSLAPTIDLITHSESNQGYSEVIQEYEENVNTLTSGFPSWADPSIFAMPFPDYPSNSIPSSSSSLPTTPSASSTTSPASDFSEISMDDLVSASSPEASCQCPRNLSIAPKRVTSSSSLVHRHRDTSTSHSRLQSQPNSYHNHSRSHGNPAVPKTSFPCTFAPCPEVFSRKHDRMRHEVAQHGLQCQWVCDRCRKFFSSDKTLAKHRCNVNIDVRWTAPTRANTGQDGAGSV
ncbi:hypothetical protein DFH05DRAFT_1512913 [Lentinula detonsa]|uniref:C2H2-type domain-containing protein n=1 Tax=Lentinula detonsa TaxID=2804962 RepID=A0A9W8NS95_9AGAR|nr:hypothetical protein DFH05DRAFT_1512913 [Lentinula detonsa]